MRYPSIYQSALETILKGAGEFQNLVLKSGSSSGILADFVNNSNDF